MKESSDNHGAEKEPKNPPEKSKKSNFSKLGRYCWILVEDFLIAIVIIMLYSLLSGFIHLLSIIPFLHIKQELVYFEKAHFGASFVVFLIFPLFSILKIIVAQSKELKNHDDH